MRRWPAYARMQDELGSVSGPRIARLWLGLMGFPLDWLDCLVTPLFLTLPSGSGEGSSP